MIIVRRKDKRTELIPVLQVLLPPVKPYYSGVCIPVYGFLYLTFLSPSDRGTTVTTRRLGYAL